MKPFFDINSFSALPDCLKPSDYVDFLLFFSIGKPVIRLGINNSEVYSRMKMWCYKYSTKYYISSSGYMYISKSRLLARIASIVDDLPIPHAVLFGLFLGYPRCCLHKISELGENKIDEWESTQFRDELLIGKFKLIDPKGYTKGESLISHVPCSNSCQASLKIAQDVYNIIDEYRGMECMRRWGQWLK